jgi:hypothetical protein
MPKREYYFIIVYPRLYYADKDKDIALFYDYDGINNLILLNVETIVLEGSSVSKNKQSHKQK